MQLLGLSLTQLLLVFAGAATATVLLYMLKQRRRRLEVPFVALWDGLLRDQASSRLFARLTHIASLLLALSVALLLTVALGDPRFTAAERTLRHTLVLIDAGMTMQATDVPGGRLAEAKAQARRVVRSAGGGQRMLVAQMDMGVTPLSSMTDDTRLLQDAVTQVSANDLPTDTSEAYLFALDVLRDRNSPELVFISDSAAEPSEDVAKQVMDAGIEVRFVPIGRRGDNVGISAFAVRRYPLDRNRSELLIELHNDSPHTEQVKLSLLGDGAQIDLQHFELSPKTQLRRVYDDITGVRETLEAHLSVEGNHDDLARDNRAYAVLPERLRTRVLCVTGGNRYLEAALLLDEYLEVDVVAPSAYRASDEHDVVIFDGHVPAQLPNKPALYITAEGAASPLPTAGRMDRPVFARLNEEHPVLRFTALRDVNVASALLVRAAAGDSVIAADERGPLIVAGERGNHKFVALTFDIRSSDLPLRVAWPLLLLNTIDWFTAARQDYVPGATVGEAAFDGEQAFLPTQIGFHRMGSGTEARLLAVNRNPKTRRDLTPPKEMRVGARTAKRPVLEASNAPFNPFIALLLAAWVLLMLEWFTYHRRWTV